MLRNKFVQVLNLSNFSQKNAFILRGPLLHKKLIIS
jgi:hypothetical protein